jgi:aminopeptidase N
MQTRADLPDGKSIAIDLYYFPKTQPNGEIDGVKINAPGHALQTARQAVERYTTLFGVLPYARLVVVEADFPDGMEFSGLVYVGHQWFAGFRGKLESWLTLITAHEIAHQWWYALVNSDQGETPYLDEALALYCEMLYLEGLAGTPDEQAARVAWWWAFRVRQRQPRGFVDASVYEYWDFRAYVNAVYLRGALMLQEIRDVVGTQTFFEWLRAYFEIGQSKIVTPENFWGAMKRADYLRTGEIRIRYLRNADPLDTPAKQP